MSNNEPTKKEVEYRLVRRCLKGDEEAQKALYDRFKGKMFGLCLRYTKDRATAEDLLQEGFIKVFNKMDTFRFEGSFEGWVRRIVMNTVIENYRKNKPLQAVVELQDYHASTIDNDALGKMSRDQLMQLIQELPEGYQMVFNLYAIEGYTHKEIAQELDISEGTSKSQLSRARKLLKKKIAEIYQVKKAAYVRAE
jgi:RNA polymerase sigma-70 factor (ECF subfamily)